VVTSARLELALPKGQGF